ncbi:hypothetical protein E4U47_006807, partial [Claviceps purpurea]
MATERAPQPGLPGPEREGWPDKISTAHHEKPVWLPWPWALGMVQADATTSLKT